MWKKHAWLEERCYFQVQRDTCHLLDVTTRKCFKLEFLSLGFPYGIGKTDQNDDDQLLLISDNSLSIVPLQ